MSAANMEASVGVSTAKKVRGDSSTSSHITQFSRAEVAKHTKENDLWIVIDGSVYDLSKFVDLHPGGAYVIQDSKVAGKDATEALCVSASSRSDGRSFQMHRYEVLTKYKRLKIGEIEGEKPKLIYPVKGALSKVPHSEPIWLTDGFSSPYYDESHKKLQKFMREFVDEFVAPDAQEKELSNERPDPELIKRMGADGVYIQHMRLGPGKHLHGLTLPGGIKGEDFTYLHEMVVTQELVRLGGARGYGDGLQGGMVIGLPPVMNFANENLKKEIIGPVLRGEKFISLAISEAFAGSDVAGLQCTAKKTPDGKHWIVNGTKKWITNGHWSDYFSTGCKTDKGLTMILIPRGEGVETKLIKTSYSTTAGTAYITFDNVKVPVENTLGKENDGLRVILSNFNHERLVMATGSCRGARGIVECCMKWAHQRKVFGKPLIAQPVIRQHLAEMIEMVEAEQAWLESIVYQMTFMNYKQQSDLLAGPIGLLKAYCTSNAGKISDKAVQIFGGRGITKSGLGREIENYQRTFKFDAILGGAEEVLRDLGVRQAMRKMPPAVL